MQGKLARRTFWATAGAILIVAGFVRFAALGSGLPNLRTRPDEAPVLRLTARPARGDFDLGWSIYPSGYVYLTWAWGEACLGAGRALDALPSLDYTTALRRHPDLLHLLARSLSALAGVGATLLLIVLGRRTLGDLPGLAAGALLATNFLHARDSHAAKPDALLALAVTAAFLAMLPLTRRATPRAGALAGLAVGAAMSMKYPGVLLGLPVYLACVLQPGRARWRFLPAPALVAGAVAAAVFLATSPFLLRADSIRDLGSVLSIVFPALSPEGTARAATGWVDPALLAQREAPAWWQGFVYHARFSLWYGAGKLATLAAPAALAWGFLCRRRVPLLLAAFVASYYVVVGLSSTGHLARYMTPLLPPLLLLEAGMLDAAARRFAGARAGVALAAGVALLAAEPLWSILAHDRIASQTDTRVLATDWLAENLPQGARVAVYGTVIYPWGAPVIPRALRPVDAEPDARSLEESDVGYLVTHDHVLAFSTVDPETLERLQPRLSLLAEFSPYDPARAHPLFEASDAYYVPFHGFAGVQRPGPRVRVYHFD